MAVECSCTGCMAHCAKQAGINLGILIAKIVVLVSAICCTVGFAIACGVPTIEANVPFTNGTDPASQFSKYGQSPFLAGFADGSVRSIVWWYAINDQQMCGNPNSPIYKQWSYQFCKGPSDFDTPDEYEIKQAFVVISTLLFFLFALAMSCIVCCDTFCWEAVLLILGTLCLISSCVSFSIWNTGAVSGTMLSTGGVIPIQEAGGSYYPSIYTRYEYGPGYGIMLAGFVLSVINLVLLLVIFCPSCKVCGDTKKPTPPPPAPPPPAAAAAAAAAAATSAEISKV